MNTKKTKVDFYVEEPCCDCGGDLELIEEKIKKGKFLSYGLDTSYYTYKCIECGKEYKDLDFAGAVGSNMMSGICFEYKGKKYGQKFKH